MNKTIYSVLLLDIGGVLLTNGWDHHMREAACQRFALDYTEMNGRHALAFDAYEIGKCTLDEYLDDVVFYESRTFSKEVFKTFMLAQSQPYLHMINFMMHLKKTYALKVFALSNEGRELMLHRIEKFRLRELIDVFICSCFTHLRKPDRDMYRLALDLSQHQPNEIIYVDDRAMLVDIGNKMGMRAVLHYSFDVTRSVLENLLQH